MSTSVGGARRGCKATPGKATQLRAAHTTAGLPSRRDDIIFVLLKWKGDIGENN